MRILVVEAIAPEGIAYLRERGVEVDELARPSLETLYARVNEYDGLITRSGTAVTAELLDHAPRLRIIGRAGVGIDNVDVEACSRRGIIVCNAPYGNVVSAAEHTVGMLLALVRRIPDAHARLKSLEWSRAIYGVELLRKTVGIVGLGKVGSRVAARLRAFDAELIVYDPYVSESRAKDLGARLTDFETLLRQSDVITVHVPLTQETDNMLTARELGRDRQRSRSPRRAGERPGRRRGHRRLERGAASERDAPPADPAPAGGRHPAPRRQLQRGAGQRRGRRRAPARRVPRR